MILKNLIFLILVLCELSNVSIFNIIYSIFYIKREQTYAYILRYHCHIFYLKKENSCIKESHWKVWYPFSKCLEVVYELFMNCFWTVYECLGVVYELFMCCLWSVYECLRLV
jgi:hypothetical protein